MKRTLQVWLFILLLAVICLSIIGHMGCASGRVDVKDSDAGLVVKDSFHPEGHFDIAPELGDRSGRDMTKVSVKERGTEKAGRDVTDIRVEEKETEKAGRDLTREEKTQKAQGDITNISDVSTMVVLICMGAGCLLLIVMFITLAIVLVRVNRYDAVVKFRKGVRFDCRSMKTIGLGGTV